MPLYNSIECSDNYLKTSGSLWKYYELSVDNAGAIIDFSGTNHKSKSFKYKEKKIVQTGNNGKKTNKNGTIKISK